MPRVAPGVYTNIIDLSLYLPKLSTTIVGIAGTAEKGPLDKAVFCSNMGQFIEVFGRPISQAGYFADEFFKQGNQLYFVRVSDGTDASASLTLQDRAGTPVNTLMVTAKSPGSWGNNIRVQVSDGVEANTFRLDVYYDTVHNGKVYTKQIERWENLSMDDANSRFVETVINDETTGSKYITALDLDSGTAAPNDNPAISGPTNLTGGLNGTSGAVNYVGTINPDGTRTGLQIFAAVEALDLNLLACPGVSDETVVTEIIDIAENQRGDCIGIIDPPFGLGPQEVVEWHNGTGGHGNTASLNSRYATMAYPWVQITDQYGPVAGSKVWVCPSAFVAARIAFTDDVAEPWISPAGPYRGRIPHAIDVEQILAQGDKELMYGYPNAVNPIISEKAFGVSIDGQKTLQRQPSALDRLNVMRMVLYAAKVVASGVKFLKHEPNDETTWRRFERLVTPFLDDIKTKRGLYAFRVQMDESTNTPFLIDQNTMNGKIYMEPVKAAEIIEVDFVVMNTGALSFTNLGV